MVDTLLVRFDVKHFFSIPASPVAELGSTIDDDVLTDHPFRQPGGGVMSLAQMTRPDIADASCAAKQINRAKLVRICRTNGNTRTALLHFHKREIARYFSRKELKKNFKQRTTRALNFLILYVDRRYYFI